MATAPTMRQAVTLIMAASLMKTVDERIAAALADDPDNDKIRFADAFEGLSEEQMINVMVAMAVTARR